MSRVSHIPYHQNVYDLLRLEPGESPEAARMIAEHEAAHGPLPASVREWYLVPNVVRLQQSEGTGEFREWGKVWHDHSYGDQPTALEWLLHGFAREPDPSVRAVWLGTASNDNQSWMLRPDGSDDPSVWDDQDTSHQQYWVRFAERFSEFIWARLSRGHTAVDTRRPWERPPEPPGGTLPLAKPHANGLWLRTPAEPFEPAAIDYLTEQLGEPERTPRPGDVTTYTFRPSGGTVRVTADAPTLAGGLSAWWVHADTPERLAELARLISPFGTLRETLHADTDPAHEVWRQVRK